MMAYRSGILWALFLSAPVFTGPICSAQDSLPSWLADTDALQWRNIGPYRGGRATTAAGVPSQPSTFYMGTTGGGLWKTDDAGAHWRNVSDGHFGTGTVGAIAIADADPSVLYVGMGEAPVRGVTTSHGDGMYKSTDAGETWTHLGLEDSHHIAEIRIDPRDPERVFVAVQGHLYGPNSTRGIYRSTNGGTTFEQILFVDEDTGACDLAMDPTNPRRLIAAFWPVRRTPWQIESGGEQGGLWRSVDGGDTWTRVTKGLPAFAGKIGVDISPAQPDRVWALVEADDGGLFRSDDGGATYRKVCTERVLRARAWYYTHVVADPVDGDTVYVMNAPLLKSIDGGRTFSPISTPHGDNHDLWIHPTDARRMINANDGGANVSVNGGQSWTGQTNQPTAQFYRVAVDRRFPYHVYGGQQDNSTICIASQTASGGIGPANWYSVGGCESAHIGFDPDDPRLVYAGCYQGLITEFDIETRASRNIMAYPFLGLGQEPRTTKYRFNWNAPIFVSPHDPSTVYHAGNVLLRTRDRGMSWTEVSPDLTYNNKERQGPGGVPITNEAAGAENYNTLMAVVESPHTEGTIWAGSDDGRVHVTRDGGKKWTEVTPDDLGNASVNCIEISPHAPDTVYVCAVRAKFDDLRPSIYRTTDGGESWTHCVKGIDSEAFVRGIREDPACFGLLVAGTEAGLYLSLDHGEHWSPWQLNLPIVPITDLTFAGDGDLVVATQGRAFWILDNLAPVRQWAELAANPVHLFQPRTSIQWGRGGGRPGFGTNPRSGAAIDYYVPDGFEGALHLEIVAADGTTLRQFHSKPAAAKKEGLEVDSSPLPASPGLHRFYWNYRRASISSVPGLFLFGSTAGPRVGPGTVRIRLTAGETSVERELSLQPHPDRPVDSRALAQQQAVADELWRAADEVHHCIRQVQSLRNQTQSWIGLTTDREDADRIRELGEALTKSLTSLEGQLCQPKQKTFQDVINFPSQLNADLLHLLGLVDGAGPPVTEGARTRAKDLIAEWRTLEAEWQRIQKEELETFNNHFRRARIPALVVPTEDG